ncbi:hypothetical protein AB0C13_40000, partial [Streptomyces sp. NPDC049099]|uniref:hypothetical protein n=1 Tax=Streptomyces sp. NPDC049099 TaxID=3155768 RepID=UPI003442DCF5
MLQSGDSFEALEMLECTAATLGLLEDAHPHLEVAEVSASAGALLAFAPTRSRARLTTARFSRTGIASGCGPVTH